MKTRLILCSILISSTIFLTGAFAGEPARFSLNEARAYAMQHSYILRNAALDVQKAQKKVWETIASGLPQVSGSANYTNFLDLSVSLIPGEFFGGEPGTYMPVKFGQDFNADYGFTVDQLIFDGSYIVGVGAAKTYITMATLTREKSEIETRNAVSQAYYMALIAQENRKVMQENLDNARTLHRDALALYQNGLTEEQDADQMKLMVQSAENEVLRTEREIRVSMMVLKYAMGVPVEEDIVLTEPLDGLIGQHRTAPVAAWDDPLSAHIDKRLIDTQTQLTRKALNLEKAAFLPKLTGFMNWSKTAYGNDANLFASGVDWYKSSLWGLKLTVPVFSSGMRLSRLQQARMDVEKAENDRKLLDQTLRKDYLTAVSDLENSLTQYKNAEDNKALAAKILDKTTIKYNHGLSSSTELAQTESQYVSAQRSWVQAVMELLNARLNYEKSIGIL